MAWMTIETLTPLQIELNSLLPGEVRVHEARIKEFREECRFFKVGALGEALEHHPGWMNEPKPEAIPSRTPRPLIPHLPELPHVSLSVLEPPVFWFGGSEREFGHLYRFGWAALIAEPLLECILAVDRDAIEFVSVTVVDGDTGDVRMDLPKCFLVMPLLAIDCIDPERSSVQLSFLEPLPGITKPMRKCAFEEYVVRNDIPSGMHIFSNVFSADLIFSNELLELARKAGVWGISARRTERGRAELGLRLYGDREQPA